MESCTERRFGVHTSLYTSLSNEQVQTLERAIYYTTVGDYVAACSIFDNDLVELKAVPVIAIERAELALQQGRYKEVWETLEVALRDGFSGCIASGVEEASFRLVKIFHSLAAIKHKGTLQPAKREVQHIRKWLADSPVSTYTDIEVDIIRKYCLASYFICQFCENDEYETSLVPCPSTSRTPWQGLTDLRISLLNRGMVFEALALFRVERGRIPLEDRAAAVASFTSRLNSCSDLSDSQLVWVEMQLSLLLAMIHQESENIPMADEALSRAESLLSRWASQAGSSTLPKEQLAIHMSIRYLRLKLISDDDQERLYRQSLDLLEDMETCGHIHTNGCVYIAQNAALKLAHCGDRPDLLDAFFDLNKRLESYDENVLGDLPDLLIDHQKVLIEAGGNAVDSRKALEWIDGFLNDYPSLSLPKPLHDLHNMRAILLRSLGEETEAACSEAIMRNLETVLPKKFGPLVGVRRASTSITLGAGAGQTSPTGHWDSRDIGSLEEDNFWVIWSSTRSDRPAQIRTGVKMLLQWMIRDLQDGVLPLAIAADVFGLPMDGSDDDIANAVKILSGLDQDAVFALLYLQLASQQESAAQSSSQTQGHQEEGGSPGPIPPETWKKRLGSLTRWFKTPSRSTSSSRQSLLLMLQSIRILTLGKDTKHREWLIIECEQALEIFSQLHPPVQQYFCMDELEWHSSIADACIEICYTSLAAILSDESEFVEKAEQHCSTAISGYVKAGFAVLAAFCERTMAQVYLMKLRKETSRKSSTSTLTRLRDTGLDFLNRADGCFDRVEVEASWAEDLEAFSSRQQVTKSHAPLLSSQVAIHLLTEGNPEPDGLVQTAIWEWVQKSKAQALAATIGLSRTDPASMVKSLQDSELASELYSRLNRLRAEISQANQRDRYHLRLKLDRHIQEMKAHEALKAIPDTREGKPLSPADLESISRNNTGDVIHVDWFYLPGFHGNPRLFLLTRKAGSAAAVDTLSTTNEKIFRWITRCIDKGKSPDKEGKLPPLLDPGKRKDVIEEISSLVEPLSRRSKQGDLLVLCPTDVLHRIPIHALEVTDAEKAKPKSLIHRNPIVYIHSHSLLRSCFWASQSVLESQLAMNPNGASYQDGKFDPRHASGHESTRCLSREFGQKLALHSASATKSAFLNNLPTTRLVHLHTHCEWNNATPLEHCIVFPQLEAQQLEAAGPMDKEHTENGLKLTAREVFSLRNILQPGTHLNLLMCSGARAYLAPGEEPFGLISALLYSGAASTVSTLWDMNDDYAAEFGRAFFSGLQKECRRLGFHQLTPAESEHGGRWVNLAKVVQRAIKEMDKGEKSVLGKWCGFVMHGFWLVWVGLEDGRKLCARDSSGAMGEAQSVISSQ